MYRLVNSLRTYLSALPDGTTGRCASTVPAALFRFRFGQSLASRAPMGFGTMKGVFYFVYVEPTKTRVGGILRQA